ncbi:hypothetical protein RF11_07672 [Thelohanellus kitauei]|uniref:Reverse transcriptase domain-containing protein n=1 Tax=Thelohanellus kitauei TaxID=669202 RepID=A0A0C2N0D2_THEKT|nr:hypothetical protein RF11_07672 [Thelohanellus kitauei]
MDNILRQNNHYSAYLDDILIFSKDIKSLFEDFEEVFKKLSNAALKLNISKCNFCLPEKNYFGFIINPKKDWKKPKCIIEMQAFLGICDYYQRFVKHYAEIVSQLYRLLNKSIPLIWNTVCKKSFSDIKKKLIEIPSLNYSYLDLAFHLHCDASDHAIGALVARQSKLSEKRQLYFSLNGLTYNWNFVVLDNWNFHCIIEFDFIRDNHIIIDQNSNKMLLPNGQYRPYKIPNVQQCIMESLIKDLLTDNIIRESSSLWYSPALLKQKKDGSNRIDQYSLPLIEELVDRLAGSKVFSIPDLISGFWQWAMNESHNEKTAFCP